jgi:hypothetical protein
LRSFGAFDPVWVDESFGVRASVGRRIYDDIDRESGNLVDVANEIPGADVGVRAAFLDGLNAPVIAARRRQPATAIAPPDAQVNHGSIVSQKQHEAVGIHPRRKQRTSKRSDEPPSEKRNGKVLRSLLAPSPHEVRQREGHAPLFCGDPRVE